MKTVVGLEIHIELKTKSKLFCDCGTMFGLPPCSQCCPICMGLPGTFPTINEEAVHLAALAGFALHSHVQSLSRFDRKQYFYPDMPRGYQITQRQYPICIGGHLKLPGSEKTVEILEMHLEDDSGKMVHQGESTFVDLNRCGVPLLEIVTTPSIENGEQAYTFLNLLRDTLVRIGVTTGKMQEGAMRIDVNISVHENGNAPSPRTEMKNLSSFKAVRAAINHEAERQKNLIRQGAKIRQETRRWDEKGGFSIAMRNKDHTVDYRYMPEVDLPPICISESKLEKWKLEIPELPEKILTRLFTLPGMNERTAAILANQPKLLKIFDTSVAAGADSKRVLNWLLGDYRAIARKQGLNPDEPPFSDDEFAHLMVAAETNAFSYQEIKSKLIDLCSE